MLQAFMDRHSLTQQQLARESGIPLSTINGIVWGTRRPRADTVNRLLKYLKRFDERLSYEDLFSQLPNRERLSRPKLRRPDITEKRRSLDGLFVVLERRRKPRRVRAAEPRKAAK